MPNYITLDGTQAYGSRTLTIGGVAYIANNITITRPTTEAEDRIANGRPGRRRETMQRAELEAELQLATSSTTYPQMGVTFMDTFDSVWGAETYVLSGVGHEETNDPGEIRTVKIRAKSVVYSITNVTS